MSATPIALSRGAAEGRFPTIPTYYDQPALKASLYGWKVSLYMFVSGLAGSAQIIATAADLTNREGYAAVVRNGRYLALAGAAIGAPLLIADLHTPQRFYNMLRIFRPTSPMSIGTYVLTGFGALSAVLAGAQAARDAGLAGPATADRVAIAAELPAAALGAAMSTYTGALLAATSTPLWAAAPRLIPALFGASAMASAAAALALALALARAARGTAGASGAAALPLSRIELIGSTVELCLLAALPARLRSAGLKTSVGIAPALLTAALPALHHIAGAIEIPRARRAPQREDRPAALEAAQRRSEVFGKVAALGVLAGAFLLRHLLLRAGNRSAERPRDYFRFARREPR